MTVVAKKCESGWHKPIGSAGGTSSSIYPRLIVAQASPPGVGIWPYERSVRKHRRKYEEEAGWRRRKYGAARRNGGDIGANRRERRIAKAAA